VSDTDWLDQGSRLVDAPDPGLAQPAPGVGAPQAPGGDMSWLDNGSRVDPTVDPTFMPGGTMPRQYPLAQGEGEVLSSGEAFQRATGGLRRFVTGEGQMDFPDMPDIMQVIGQSGVETPGGMGFASPASAGGGGEDALRMGIMAASEPAQVVDIALANLPGSTASQDSQGNPIINWQGEQYYAWKPGFRQQDALRLAAQTVPYGAASRVAVQATGGLLSRVAGLLGLNAATSGALDVAAGAAGSQQGVSVPRAVMAGVGGAAGEELLRPMGNVALRSAGRESVLDATGTVRPEVSEALRQEGIELTGEQAALFADLMRRSTDPLAAARYAQSQTLPVDIPETLGSATRSPIHQMTENQARDGVFGEAAQQIAEQAQNNQARAIRENVPAIQSIVGGGQRRVTGKGEAGEMAQANLLAQEARARGAVDTLYDRARATPAAVSGGGVDEFVGRLNEGAQDYLHNEGVRGRLQDLRDAAAEGDLSVDTLFNWRSRISKLANNAGDRETGAGLRDLVRAFDANVEDTVKTHLLAGDETAARNWLRGIKGRRNMGSRFQGRGDLVADLVETEAAGGRSRLVVAPEAASNLIFGRANLGFASKPELARELFQLRKTLGRNSDAWQALREEAFLRFGANLEGAQAGGQVSVSGAKAKTAWERALRDASPVVNTLFNESERNLITQFFRTAERITNPVRGGRNYSGTSQGLANIVRNLNDTLFVGPKGKAWLSRVFP